MMNQHTREAKLTVDMARTLVKADGLGDWDGENVNERIRCWTMDLVWDDKEPTGETVTVYVPTSLLDQYSRLMDTERNLNERIGLKDTDLRLVDPRGQEYRDRRAAYGRLLDQLDRVREARRSLEDAMTWTVLAQL